VAVYVRRNGGDRNRIGITVTNKLGKAVRRNRVRRRLREIYRLNEDKLARGMDMVVVARMRSRGVTYAELESDFLRACRKLGVLRDGGGAEA
jgi:ribonuclease P protein component